MKILLNWLCSSKWLIMRLNPSRRSSLPLPDIWPQAKKQFPQKWRRRAIALRCVFARALKGSQTQPCCFGGELKRTKRRRRGGNYTEWNTDGPGPAFNATQVIGHVSAYPFFLSPFIFLRVTLFALYVGSDPCSLTGKGSIIAPHVTASDGWSAQSGFH